MEAEEKGLEAAPLETEGTVAAQGREAATEPAGTAVAAETPVASVRAICHSRQDYLPETHQ